MRSTVVLPLLTVLLALPAAAVLPAQAQAGQARSGHVQPTDARPTPRPPGWTIRYDRPDAVDSTFHFVAMAPGWHVTTGPAAIVYEPGATASGDYRVESELFLFPGQRAEGFGLFIGGHDLEGAGQRYTYFLLRKDGRFLVKQRDGATTRDLVPWTAHAAIAPHDAPAGTVKHVLGVDARADSVRFLVNGTQVAALPRAAVAADGVVGLRVNHALNLHVTSLTVTRP